MSKLPLPLAVARNVILLVVFFFGCISLVWTQYVFSFIFRNKPSLLQNVINSTKKQFIQLLTFVLSTASPTNISITYDPMQIPATDLFTELSDGVVSTLLTPNSVMISNHQIYTDWFYLWFLTYTSRLSEYVYIILKDMSKIPIIGYGMTNFNFMFLSRKWDKDKVRLTNQLLRIDADARGAGPASGVKHVISANTESGIEDYQAWPGQKITNEVYPYMVLLFPEGTVPSIRTSKKSREFCEENGLPILKHVLLPRVRGLFLVLRKLRNTVNVVYDITTGYDGLKEGEYGEDKYTLKKVFLLGQGPKNISYHFRSFAIQDIPLGDETLDIDDVNPEDLKKFEQWLFKVWYEKDQLMDDFYKYGTFLNEKNDTIEKVKGYTVAGQIKPKHRLEFLSAFGTAALTIFLFAVFWRGVHLFLARFIF